MDPLAGARAPIYIESYHEFTIVIQYACYVHDVCGGTHVITHDACTHTHPRKALLRAGGALSSQKVHQYDDYAGDFSSQASLAPASSTLRRAAALCAASAASVFVASD